MFPFIVAPTNFVPWTSKRLLTEEKRVERRPKLARLVSGSVAAIVAFVAAPAEAQMRCWTSVGSAGSVDEADLDLVDLSTDTAAVRGSASQGTVDIVYNVTAVPGVFSGECHAKTLSARIADTGPESQVLLRLRRLNIANGQTADLIQLDSDEFPTSSVAQKRDASEELDSDFDFQRNVYHVVVELRKIGPAGNPLVRAIQICGRQIC